MNSTALLAVGVLSSALWAVPVRAATFTIDPAHSSVSFRVRHLMSKVRGRFDKFSGSVDYEPGKPDAWKVAADIDPASVDTGNSQRDGHLRTADFFDVEKCPKMSFRSTKVLEAAGDKAKLQGELTMHCVTKPVTLALEIGGMTKNQMGAGMRMGATATGTLNRKDWGLSWNKALEAGGVMVGEDVELEIDVEASSEAPKPKK